MLLVVGIFFYLEMKRATSRIFTDPFNAFIGSKSSGCADELL